MPDVPRPAREPRPEGGLATLLPCGDGAVLIDVGAGDPEHTALRVLALEARIVRVRPHWLVETVPGLRTLLVEIDANLVDIAAAAEHVLEAAATVSDAAAPRAGRQVTLTVCFDGRHAPDLEDVGRATGLGAAGVVAALTARPLTVGLIGHLPGLPYLVGLPDRFDVPRRPSPRPRVEAGSVGVAAGMACIYPMVAPGGWHLVGRAGARLHDPGHGRPSALAAGDRVWLRRIPAAALDAQLAAGGVPVETDR